MSTVNRQRTTDLYRNELNCVLVKLQLLNKISDCYRDYNTLLFHAAKIQLSIVKSQVFLHFFLAF